MFGDLVLESFGYWRIAVFGTQLVITYVAVDKASCNLKSYQELFGSNAEKPCSCNHHSGLHPFQWTDSNLALNIAILVKHVLVLWEAACHTKVLFSREERRITFPLWERYRMRGYPRDPIMTFSCKEPCPKVPMCIFLWHNSIFWGEDLLWREMVKFSGSATLEVAGKKLWMWRCLKDWQLSGQTFFLETSCQDHRSSSKKGSGSSWGEWGMHMKSIGELLETCIGDLYWRLALETCIGDWYWRLVLENCIVKNYWK